MHIRILALTVAILALASGAQAAHSPPVLLHDVRVIDGGGGQPLEHADILIKGSKIAAIDTQTDPKKLPRNTITVNLTGKTVLPGLISNHSHLEIGRAHV